MGTFFGALSLNHFIKKETGVKSCNHPFWVKNCVNKQSRDTKQVGEKPVHYFGFYKKSAEANAVFGIGTGQEAGAASE